jgi:HAD superfamily hydrolase (TIGR01509 family)
MIHAGIFDKDGVLAETEELHLRAFSETLRRRYGISIGMDFGYVGLPPPDVFRYFLSKHGVSHEEGDIESLISESTKNIIDLLRSGWLRPKHGVHDVLEAFKKAGFELGMVTSAPREEAMTCINTLGIDHYFPVVITMEDTPGRGKPDPAPYALAVHRLGMRPEECFAVDDAPNGVKSATDAGIRCIGFKTPYINDQKKLEEAGAVAVVSSLREISPDLVWNLERA